MLNDTFRIARGKKKKRRKKKYFMVNNKLTKN
jgi:hypothetical protein